MEHEQFSLVISGEQTETLRWHNNNVNRMNEGGLAVETWLEWTKTISDELDRRGA